MRVQFGDGKTNLGGGLLMGHYRQSSELQAWPEFTVSFLVAWKRYSIQGGLELSIYAVS